MSFMSYGTFSSHEGSRIFWVWRRLAFEPISGVVFSLITQNHERIYRRTNIQGQSFAMLIGLYLEISRGNIRLSINTDPLPSALLMITYRGTTSEGSPVLDDTITLGKQLG